MKIIAEIRKRDEHVGVQASNGIDATLLRQRQCTAICSSIARTQGVTIEDANSVGRELRSMGWTPDQKVAIATCMSDQSDRGDGMSASTVTRKPQRCRMYENYLTADDWEVYGSKSFTIDHKANHMGTGMYKKGLKCPDPSVLKKGAALLHIASELLDLSGDSKRNVTRTIKDAAKAADKATTYPLEHIINYPDDPSALPKAMFEMAYAETGGPVPCPAYVRDQLAVQVSRMPYRNTHSAITSNDTSAPRVQLQQTTPTKASGRGELQLQPPQT